MKLHLSRRTLPLSTRPVIVLTGVLSASVLSASTLQAQQTYHNIVNQRFRTVGSGPQSAIIVDVSDPNDTRAVQRAVNAKVDAVVRSRAPILQRQVDLLRRHGLLKPGEQIPITEIVMIRHNGRLVSPKIPRATRDVPPGNDVTFNIPTTDTSPGVDGAWSPGPTGEGAQVAALVNLIKPEIVALMGRPLWNGQVTILNKDPFRTKVQGITGTILVINSTGGIELWFPFIGSTYEPQYLGMAQGIAQAFHGPNLLGYDPWEKGMARAVAVAAAVQQNPKDATGVAIDPVPTFFFTPYYDLLNQPPLGNTTFEPPTKSGQDLNFGGMLIPRLQMSGTAWLKCYTEDAGFFVKFNNNYYNALAADPNAKNNVSTLRTIAQQSLATGTVEGQDFQSWFEQQYIFDTSIRPGPKVYAFTFPTPADTASTIQKPEGFDTTLVYYQTTVGADELDLNGTTNPVFYDYTYTNRLTLGNTAAQYTITGGIVDVSPFTNGIGDPAQMRLAVDYPVGSVYTRIFFPANEFSDKSGNPNDFTGVIVGANAGDINVAFNGGNGTGVGQSIKQGAFGGYNSAGAIPNGQFTQATITFLPTGASAALTYKRNVFTRKDNPSNVSIPGISPMFILSAPGPTVQQTHTFLQGPQMISFPFKPLKSDLAALLKTDPNKTLLAQYRQDTQISSTMPDKYARYPNLPLYQPGYGLWSNFTGALNNIVMAGEPTDNQDRIEVPLLYGWNQIGTPYTTSVLATGTASGLEITYLNGDVVSLEQAITNGWVSQGIFAYDPTTSGYKDITDTSVSGSNKLDPWQGYWIRVAVTEGVTLTYVNGSAPTKAVHPSRSRASRTIAPDHGAWRIPVVLHDPSGSTAVAVFGQSSRGAEEYVPALDAANPPAFTRAATLNVHFPHTDWDGGTAAQPTEFLTDIRRSASRSSWNMMVRVPQGEQSYSLTWNSIAKLPRGTRLTLVDVDSGTRLLMNAASSYTFTPNQGATTRRFQITAEPHNAGRINVSNLRIDAPRAGGRGVPTSATISYELTGVAEASVQISNGTGRIVRRLANTRAASSGVNQTVWDLRDDHGRVLLVGTYFVQVTVKTPEGELSRAVAPHIISR